MNRSYSDQVMRFRKGVYAARRRLTPGCQLLLLRLSDDMDAKAIVSVPRSLLAESLDCPPVRITEWVNEAIEANFLSRVRRGRPGVTAVYHGLVNVPEVRPGVPSQRYATTNQAEVRPGVPTKRTQRYAPAYSQVVEPSGTSGAYPDPDDEKRQRGGAGEQHPARVRVLVDDLGEQDRKRTEGRSA